MEKIELKIPNIDDKIYKVFLIQDKFHTSVSIEKISLCDDNSINTFQVAIKCYILNNKVISSKWSPDVDELLQINDDISWNIDTLRHLQYMQNAIDNYMLENMQQYILSNSSC